MGQDHPSGPITSATVRAALAGVHDQIVAAGGDPARVQVLAVTKGFGPEVAAAAVGAGLTDLGENYAQELVGKAPVVAEDADSAVRWHFIGQLQSNKVRALAPWVSVWQSVDRASQIDEIAKRAPGATMYVQANATQEMTKGGCPLAEVPALVDYGRTLGLDVNGVMTLGAAGDERSTAAAFAAVAAVADACELVHRSMGMSGDIGAAVAAGSTMIRIGTALFGNRLPR